MSIDNKKTIAVVGLGYVGLPLALLADQKGYRVLGIDIDAERIARLTRRETLIKDEMVKHALPNTQVEFTTDYSKLTEAETVIICVPTPVNHDHLPDLTIVKKAAESTAKYLQPGQLIILESTVNPDVTEYVVLPILEEVSGLKGGTDFYLAHAPERINPGDPKWTVENINRVVGSLEEVGLERAVEFYKSIISGTVTPMKSLKEAEAVKVVENSFRDINIAFVNELARSFSRLDIDIVNVINGAATKPFAFMPHYPGCGVGGHCIPVDPYYLIEHARKNGFEHEFLSLARRINNDMPQFTVDKVSEALASIDRSIESSSIAVLGVSYKANIDDTRESPAYSIIEQLKALTSDVRIFDPYSAAESTVPSLESALDKADAVVLVTAHNEFKALQPHTFVEHGVAVVVDGRNVFDKELLAAAGIVYKGIGR